MDARPILCTLARLLHEHGLEAVLIGNAAAFDLDFLFRKTPANLRKLKAIAKYEDGVFKPLEEVTIDEGIMVEVRLPSYIDRLKTKSPSVREFAFYGMWKDRADIGDSVEYVNKLRRELRG